MFMRYEEISKDMFYSFENVSTTLKKLEDVSGKVSCNGAMMGGLMFSDGFYSATTGTGKST